MLSNKNLLKYFSGIVFYFIAALSAIILIKTELRKWFAFDGEPTSSNTIVFWVSLISVIFFIWIGSKIWPDKKNDKSDNKNG